MGAEARQVLQSPARSIVLSITRSGVSPMPVKNTCSREPRCTRATWRIRPAYGPSRNGFGPSSKLASGSFARDNLPSRDTP